MERVKRQQHRAAWRGYALRVDADRYVEYQEMARRHGVSLSRFFTETLEYSLHGGAEPPTWWNDELHQVDQPALIDVDDREEARVA